MRNNLRSILQQRIKGIYKKHIIDFEKEVTYDIKKLFKESIDEWIKDFERWKESKGQNPRNNFDILYAAGSLYRGANKPKVTPYGNFGYISTMEVGPEYLDENKVTFISQWGDRKGEVFPNEDAFNLMYNSGIYGYDLDIVKRSWYKNESPKKRNQIINFLRLYNVIPPDPFNTPDSIMDENFKTIQSKKYLDKKWEKYDKKIKRDLKRR